MPFDLLPPNLLDACKVVFVVRNVKDACVSYFHHKQLTSGYSGDFKTFAHMFKRGIMYHQPFFGQVLGAWQRRRHPNVFFVSYEEMKSDLDDVLRRLCSFLEVSITDEEMKRLKEAVDIESFRKNPAVNKEQEVPAQGGKTFIRKGIVGDWQDHFDEETNEEWDEWIHERLSGSDMPMTFKLDN